MYQRIKDFLAGRRYGAAYLNRSVLMVYPKAPYWRWLGQQHDPDSRKNGTAYLVPMVHGAEALENLLQDAWPSLFGHQLLVGKEDHATWPNNRSLQMFHEWFDVHMADT